MTSGWGKIDQIESVNFQEIMSEEFARGLEIQDVTIKKKPKKVVQETTKTIACKMKEVDDGAAGSSGTSGYAEAAGYSGSAGYSGAHLLPLVEPIPEEVLRALAEDDGGSGDEVDSDAVIAQLLQAQFDLEYDQQVKREEKHQNKDSKVSISLKNYRVIPEELVYHDSSDENEMPENQGKKDWDRFETNEKESKSMPRCGYKVDYEGEMVTKHDAVLNGRKNACKVMSFPPEFSTGDGAGFDMKLSNTVFNQLKSHSKKCIKKQHKAQDRRENIATAEMGLDEPTRLILYKLINNQVLESVDGIISKGKEAVILHGETDPSNPEIEEGKWIPKEVAIKIFSTTLNEFKQRDRYIKDDYRFQGRFSKQNARTVINMWAEKELHNLIRMKKVGIKCPDVVVLKKNILIMSFIGDNFIAAPKLKEAILSEAELIIAYEEIVEIMWKLYNEAKLVHADFSEYNILWYNGECWVIDVAQAVEPMHPGALEFLMRDCDNICTFFTKRGVTDVKTKEELFFHITNLDPLTHNTTMLERIHMKGEPVHVVTRQTETEDGTPEHLKPLAYPFDYAWEKVENLKKKRKPLVGKEEKRVAV